MTNHTPGPWRKGKDYGAIVADAPTGGPYCGDTEAYGGHLVCESVAPDNMPLIIAAPDMLEALQMCVIVLAFMGGRESQLYEVASAAISKATEVNHD